MNRWARVLFLGAFLLGAASALALEEEEDTPEEMPAPPSAAQATGVRAALDSPDPAVQREAFRILARAGWAHRPGRAPNEISVTPEEAAARLDDSDPDVCRAAVILLGNMGLGVDSPWMAKIAALRADRRPAVAQAAAWSLRRREKPGAPRTSLPFALSSEEALRRLGEVDPPRCLDAAEALVCRRGETREVSRAAARGFVSGEEGPSHPVVTDLLRRAPSPPGTLPGELAALLPHADATIRCAALHALGQVSAWTDVHVSEIGSLLGDASPAVRAEAAHVLAQSSAAAPFLPALAACLADPEPGVRGSAADALGQMGPASAAPHLPALATLLNDAEADVRLSAVRALSSLGETAAHAEEIVALLGTRSVSSVNDRDTAATVLTRLSEAPPAALRALAARCADPDPEVRILALEVLGSMGANFVENAMRAAGELTPDAKPDFSRWSGGPAAAFSFAASARLDDPDHYVRAAALDALGAMGREGAVFAREIAARLRDRDPEMRCTALRALSRMGALALPFSSEIAARRHDLVPGVRAQAARTLGFLPADFTALLLESARDPSAEVRHAALDILEDASLPRPAVTAVILARLEDRDEGVRGVAARRLGELVQRHPPFLARFAARLSDRRPAARQVTVQRLDSIARETVEAGAARDFLVAVLRVLPALGEEERARVRAHLHVWVGHSPEVTQPNLRPAVEWLGRPRRTPTLSAFTPDSAGEALVAFREVWDGTDAKRDAGLRREMAQRSAEVAAALPTAPDEATSKVLGEWSERLGLLTEFKDCRRSLEDALKRRPAAP